MNKKRSRAAFLAQPLLRPLEEVPEEVLQDPSPSRSPSRPSKLPAKLDSHGSSKSPSKKETGSTANPELQDGATSQLPRKKRAASTQSRMKPAPKRFKSSVHGRARRPVTQSKFDLNPLDFACSACQQPITLGAIRSKSKAGVTVSDAAGLRSMQCLKCLLIFHQKCSSQEFFCDECFGGFEGFLKEFRTKYYPKQRPPRSSSLQKPNLKFQVGKRPRKSTSLPKPSADEDDNGGVLKLPQEMSTDVKETSILSMARALYAKGFEYSGELVYNHPQVPRKANDASKEEGGVQRLSRKNLAVLEQSRSVAPPVIVQYTRLQGFFVTAAQAIPALTFICEYVGEVRKESMVQLANDSIMSLVEAGEESLVVVPERFANVGRYFNGINNFVQREKPNLSVMRCQVRNSLGIGEVRVLLYTNRRVEKGDQLIFDYNLGCPPGELTYDTSQFV